MLAYSYNKLPIFPIFLVLSSLVLPSFRLEFIDGKNDEADLTPDATIKSTSFDRPPTNTNNKVDDPVAKLSKIFGFEVTHSLGDDSIPQREKWKDGLRSRVPPEYMMELYKNVAYQDGVSRLPNPFQADIVRGMSDRAPRNQRKYFFNLSNIHEDVLEAEFHLFKMKPSALSPLSPSSLSSSSLSSSSSSSSTLFSKWPKSRTRRSLRLFDIKLYQILQEGADENHPDRLFLLHQRRISTSFKPDWEIFKVGETVRQWISKPSSNYGFLVVATSTEGSVMLNEEVVRFAQRLQHHDSKQPVLVIFSDQEHISLDFEEDPLEELNYEPPAPADSNLKAMRQNYIRFLNEEYRHMHSLHTSGDLPGEKQDDDTNAYHNQQEQQNPSKSPRKKKRQQHFMNPQLHEKLVGRKPKHRTPPSPSDLIDPCGSGNNTNADNRFRSERCSYPRHKRAPRKERLQNRSKKQQGNEDLSKWNHTKGGRKSCQRYDMHVDFKTIGWSEWIISPQGYNAYQCKGSCPFPLGKNLRPTNHATVQSIVHVLRGHQDQSKNRMAVGSPCCVPSKLYSISLLYFDDTDNVVLKQYDEMVAGSCGCH